MISRVVIVMLGAKAWLDPDSKTSSNSLTLCLNCFRCIASCIAVTTTIGQMLHHREQGREIDDELLNKIIKNSFYYAKDSVVPEDVKVNFNL